LIDWDVSKAYCGQVWFGLEPGEGWAYSWCFRGYDGVPLVRGTSLGAASLLMFSRDINSYTKGTSTIEPTTVFKGHNSVVGVCCILHVCKQVTN
jgi:hypothetical protein